MATIVLSLSALFLFVDGINLSQHQLSSGTAIQQALAKAEAMSQI
jgi:hypothetical protein